MLFPFFSLYEGNKTSFKIFVFKFAKRFQKEKRKQRRIINMTPEQEKANVKWAYLSS